MKIFISGIAGFLGSHLADRMVSLGHNVSGCDNLIGGYLDNVPKKAKFYQVDCNDFTLMKNRNIRFPKKNLSLQMGH